ncbi:MAG: NAD(+) kinase [Thermoplasmataceae archaeon]|nr:NAD(+) kinase [Candidatus Thermoplasmatota archaeon]
MKIAFVVRKDCKRCSNVVKRIIEILPPEWEKIYESEASKYLNTRGRELEKLDADIIIAVGGDGTALRALQLARGPILGINMGGLGFLNEVEIGDVEKSIYSIIRGDYKIEKTMKLSVKINGVEVEECTNEVVIHTSKISKIRKFKIYVSDNFIDGTNADGVIVATPIGSTSYSYSAGGPLVLPSMDAMVISYLAPFGTRVRPIVASPAETVRVKLVGKDQQCTVILDGQVEYPINSSDTVEISVSKHRAQFVTLRQSFYERIREKLIKYVVN